MALHRSVKRWQRELRQGPKGLDGRPIRIQGKNYAALNYLLQSAGAIICKRWVTHANRLSEKLELIIGLRLHPR